LLSEFYDKIRYKKDIKVESRDKKINDSLLILDITDRFARAMGYLTLFVPNDTNFFSIFDAVTF